MRPHGAHPCAEPHRLVCNSWVLRGQLGLCQCTIVLTSYEGNFMFKSQLHLQSTWGDAKDCAIGMKLGLSHNLDDFIYYTNFCSDLFRGFRSAKGQKSPSILFA
jgi:hypothetical protein